MDDLVRPPLAGLGRGACELSELLVLLFREPASGYIGIDRMSAILVIAAQAKRKAALLIDRAAFSVF